MKEKLLGITIIILVVTMLFSSVQAQSPSIIGTSTSSYATSFPYQRKSFYSAGRFWVFYSDGTNMVYSDGSTWNITYNVVLEPTEDTFDDSEVPSQNFGTNTLLYAYGAPTCITYLRFDLSNYIDINITSAILSLKVSATNAWDNNKVRKITTGYDTWGENTTIWNNHPSNTATGEVTIGVVANSYNNATITDMVKDCYANQSRKVNICVSNWASASAWCQYTSRESSSKPKLYLSYSKYIARAASYGYDFSVWFDGTYVHYAYASTSSIYYRRGTPNADGTITWSAAEQTVSTTYNAAYYPYISVDSNGYVWIGYYESSYPYVIKSQWNNGTFGTGTITQLSTTSSSYWRVSIIPLTSGKMLALYAYDGATVKAKAWNGSAWGAEAATASAIYKGSYYSAVAQGDDVHLVFLHYMFLSNFILYVKYSYSNNSFGSETLLGTTSSGYSAPVIGFDTVTKNLYVFVSFTTEHIYYIKYIGSWGSWIDWIDETGIQSDGFTCFYQAYNDKMGLVYLTYSGGTYYVKFDYLATRTWNLGEFWETNYDNIQEQDVLLMADTQAYHNWTNYFGSAPWLKYSFEGDYILTFTNNSFEGLFSFQDFTLLQPSINFAQIKNVTLQAGLRAITSGVANFSFRILPNGSYVTQSIAAGGGAFSNYTVADIKPYLNGINQLSNIQISVNTTFNCATSEIDFIVLKVYYYPNCLAIYDYQIWSSAEYFVATIFVNLLLTFVRWGVLGLGLLFLVLSIIFLWIGFKYRKGVILVSALIVFLLGIALAISGAGI